MARRSRRRYAGHLTDIPDVNIAEGEGSEYPIGAAQDQTLSRDAEHATVTVYRSLPGVYPPSGDAALQTLNAPTPEGAPIP